MADALDEALRAMQLYAAGLISRRTAIGMLGFIKDPDAEAEQIEREQLAAAERVAASRGGVGNVSRSIASATLGDG